jgi:NodT family efflux transporter outer membrane factor (OMF) lipoprotein
VPQIAGASLRLADWWKSFDDPILNRLVEEAVQSNLDVKLASARIREARAQRRATIAAGLPTLDARSGASRRRNSANFSQQTGGGANTGGGGFGVGRQLIDIFQMGFDAQWELDFFGGVQRAMEAADANLEAEEEGRRDALVSLLGDIARNYIELRANQQKRAVTLANLRSQEETLGLIRQRRRAGLASELEVAQAEALAAVDRAQAPDYEIAVQQAIHALSVLLGRAPGQLAARLERDGPVPVSAAPGLADLPAELLRRRPDIRRAERKLAATNADIGAAVAELYPKINLSAFLGLQNTRIADFTPIGKSWSMASSLSMPLFNWGRLQANVKAKEALHEQAFIGYQSIVLNAFKEVEDALVAHAQALERRLALVQAVEAQTLALRLAQERYEKGLTAYLDALEAERGLQQAQRDLVDGQARQSLQLAALYKALGGGWNIAEPAKPPESALPARVEQLLDTGP